MTTKRLGLRTWLPADAGPFASMNADPKVMRYMPKRLSRQESDAFMKRIQRHFNQHGFGLYAADELVSGVFMGFIGFQTATFAADFTPCVEIGWRLHPRFWGQGLATEGGKACLRYAFTTLELDEICSFTAVVNTRSVALMKRIGLIFRKRFGHPGLQPGHRLHEHVLYGLSRAKYTAQDI